MRRRPSTRHQPVPPLKQWPQEDKDRALRLRRALRRMIEARNDTTITKADLEIVGVEDYEREFKRAVSARCPRDGFATCSRSC